MEEGVCAALLGRWREGKRKVGEQWRWGPVLSGAKVNLSPREEKNAYKQNIPPKDGYTYQNSISRYFWKMKPRVIYSVKEFVGIGQMSYTGWYYICNQEQELVQNLSFKSTLRLEVCSSVTPWAARAWTWHIRETHRQLRKSSSHHVNHASCLGGVSFSTKRCPTELPALMEMFLPAPSGLAAIQPHVALDTWSMAVQSQNWSLHLIEIALRCPWYIQLRFLIFKS